MIPTILIFLLGICLGGWIGLSFEAAWFGSGMVVALLILFAPVKKNE